MNQTPVGSVAAVSFGPDGLVPVIAQDDATGDVLMLAYMNREALERTLQSGRAWFWSRARQTLWKKGESSGNEQVVRGVYLDCDGDALLLRVDPLGPACHTGHRTCFFRSPDGRDVSMTAGLRTDVLGDLFMLLEQRRRELPAGSYTAGLLRAGRGAIGAKVEEEAEELVRAAREESDVRVAEEAADIIYHAWVLLVERGISLDAVRAVLETRRGR